MFRTILSLFIILLFSTVLAASVQITEIQPFSINGEPEWFEFLVQSKDGVIDISDWYVSNGKTKKRIGDEKNRLLIPEGTQLLTGSGYSTDTIAFRAEDPTFFSWTKSPVSLGNSGGVVRLLDHEENLLTEVTYPKGKSGSRKAYKYAEVFNWDSDKHRVYPLIFRSDGNPAFRHTKGYTNKKSPSFAEDFKMVISEISPNRDKEKGGDFIEFYVVSGDKEVNLKYLEIKHNGTPLYYFTDDFWVSPDQFLTLWVGRESNQITKNTAPFEIVSSKKEGLSSGSGTVELIIFSDTSYEKTIDFTCYKNKELSKTEQNRVHKNQDNWHSDCIEISGLIPNQSIARANLQQDTDSKHDFFNHYNGSPGAENKPNNHKPKAVITVQGSKKVIGSTPFTINLTGEGSVDSDGVKDIISYKWLLGDRVFSTEANPKSFKINDVGTYTISLVVTDHSGAEDIAKQIFNVVPVGSATSGGSKKDVKTFIENKLTYSESQDDGKDYDFFSDFITQAPDFFWENLEEKDNERLSFNQMQVKNPVVNSPDEAIISRKDQWIKKNIGWALAPDSLDGLK